MDHKADHVEHNNQEEEEHNQVGCSIHPVEDNSWGLEEDIEDNLEEDSLEEDYWMEDSWKKDYWDEDNSEQDSWDEDS